MSKIRDLAIGRVLTGPGTAGDTLILETNQGGDMPTTLPYKLLAYEEGVMPTKYNAEMLLVTAQTDDTLTITRAQGETTAKDIQAGWLISNNIFVSDMYEIFMDMAWPIGSVYENAEVSTNPAELLGVGTWVALGPGRVTVAIDPTQTEFDTLGETGGEKAVTLTEAQMPSHTHTQNAHGHAIYHYVGNAQTGATNLDDIPGSGNRNVAGEVFMTNTRNTTATNQNTGGGGAHNNLQPYTVVYRWKRTA